MIDDHFEMMEDENVDEAVDEEVDKVLYEVTAGKLGKMEAAPIRPVAQQEEAVDEEEEQKIESMKKRLADLQ